MVRLVCRAKAQEPRPKPVVRPHSTVESRATNIARRVRGETAGGFGPRRKWRASAREPEQYCEGRKQIPGASPGSCERSRPGRENGPARARYVNRKKAVTNDPRGRRLHEVEIEITEDAKRRKPQGRLGRRRGCRAGQSNVGAG